MIGKKNFMDSVMKTTGIFMFLVVLFSACGSGLTVSKRYHSRGFSIDLNRGGSAGVDAGARVGAVAKARAGAAAKSGAAARAGAKSGAAARARAKIGRVDSGSMALANLFLVSESDKGSGLSMGKSYNVGISKDLRKSNEFADEFLFKCSAKTGVAEIASNKSMAEVNVREKWVGGRKSIEQRLGKSASPKQVQRGIVGDAWLYSILSLCCGVLAFSILIVGWLFGLAAVILGIMGLGSRIEILALIGIVLGAISVLLFAGGILGSLIVSILWILVLLAILYLLYKMFWS